MSLLSDISSVFSLENLFFGNILQLVIANKKCIQDFSIYIELSGQWHKMLFFKPIIFVNTFEPTGSINTLFSSDFPYYLCVLTTI